MTGQGSSQNDTFNLVSIFFVALTVLVCLISFMIMGNVLPAGPFEPPTDVPEATSLLSADGKLPTPTVTSTPRPTTVPGATNTPTPSPTWTGVPSLTPTDTVTLPPPTATIESSATFTFTPTDTEIPTDLPTDAPTLTPEVLVVTATPATSGGGFFTQPNPPIYREAFLHPGCQWQGIGGQVITATGEHLGGLTVRVTASDGAIFTAITGSNLAYGNGSGWEIATSTALVSGAYTVEIVTADLSQVLSESVFVAFGGNCQQSLALITFVQQ